MMRCIYAMEEAEGKEIEVDRWREMTMSRRLGTHLHVIRCGIL